jgi:phosphoribosylaminoimidazole-succinocarboxamide synthase
MQALTQSDVPGYPVRRGKVRDVYDLGEALAIVATDRISAFDWIMPNGIPGKGELLTRMTTFWLDWLGVPNHRITEDLSAWPAFQKLAGRTMIVKKAQVVPFECVARGYLAGSGWKEYKQSGTVCGIPIRPGLKEYEKLPEPIFTPATKAEEGHDENVPFARMVQDIGQPLAEELRSKTLDVYRRAAEYAQSRGILLADTKLEWGRLPDRSVILIDEVLTPDSSRFWPASSYQPGRTPPSFDKQYLRDWLETTTWDKASPPPELPVEVVARTQEKYQEAVRRLTGPA